MCLCAILVPLVACLTLQATTGEWHAPTLAALLGGTLLGAVFGLATIHALLRPIARAADMLGAVQNGEPVARIPVAGDDLVGRLLRGVTTAANESALRIEALIETAERDPLTGVRNRNGFLDSAKGLLRDEGTAVLALVEIDHFALITERFGESASENLVKAIARRLEAGLRRTDIVGRWDSIQFSVLLPQTLLDEARQIMERLRASVALDESLSGQGWPVTFSCGLAPVRAFSEFHDSLRQADAMLDEARNSGRNKVLALTH
ncbi:GGDEF domain-containing protein [Novosphingobium mangrovi (ex Huang et al. 2023)]|uniref:diguanylate cyclase n=1 Tax=Novosphingobium mangrovi (ex Huang et al. 2023) TaxID=2976432 RepID=A0ABT2HZX6_9SPHN|nr:GGDEF domain-containing protein [Novosphingobium mangrovi (ex Huang et al. 2023)]MCT2398092.1 GGDEF domain-containing protein [Novosphingobium mangrovi (ex Huang et al. 2023)]